VKVVERHDGSGGRVKGKKQGSGFRRKRCGISVDFLNPELPNPEA